MLSVSARCRECGEAYIYVRETNTYNYPVCASGHPGPPRLVEQRALSAALEDAEREDDDSEFACAELEDEADNEASLSIAEPVQQVEAGQQRKQSQATQVLALVARTACELWHTPDGEAWLSYSIDEHCEHAALTSKRARIWLAGLYYKQQQRAISAQSLHDALSALSAKALFEGPERAVAVRVAECESSIYIDLCDDAWRAVRVTADGWEVVNNPPVCFRRARGMLPLPLPARGGSLEDLRAFVNVSDDDWPLLLTWLVAALRPRGPYPLLALISEQGSGKSTLARVLRTLVDPNVAAIRAQPRDDRDLVIAAANGWVVALDNLSRVEAWLSDGLCRLATGGGLATRALYTDDEERIFDSQRPIILNGIEDVVTRGDLLDRAILIHLPSIAEECRVPEGTLWTAFERARPGILGALLDAVACAMRRLPTTKLEKLPRMADFALWAAAAEPALGWEAGTFIRAYASNRQEANSAALEGSPIVAPLREVLAQQDLGGGSRRQRVTCSPPWWPRLARQPGGYPVGPDHHERWAAPCGGWRPTCALSGSTSNGSADRARASALSFLEKSGGTPSQRSHRHD